MQRHLVLLLVAIVVASLNMRLGIAAPGPVIESIRLDTAMSSGVAGLLVTIPFVCMSLFSFTGPPALRRLSPYAVILIALILIAGGTLARAVAPDAALVLLATIPIGAGIAVMGVALPVLVKIHFARWSGAVTSAYITGMSVGVLVFTAILVPLAELLGSWREAFAVSALPALLGIAMWIWVHRPGVMPAGTNREPVSDPVATANRFVKPQREELMSAASFGLQSMTYSALAAWIAVIYTEQGWSAGTAALLIGLGGLMTIPGAFIAAGVSRGKDRRPFIAGSVVVFCLALFGIALAPDVTPWAAWAYVTVWGLFAGGAFALQLAMPIDVRRTALGVARLTAWMLGLGYLLSAATPIMIGVLRDATGGFELPMTLLAVFASIGVVVAFLLPAPLPKDPGYETEPLPSDPVDPVRPSVLPPIPRTAE
ncbi:MAG: MFS transporter [Solirubrobacterales bacterium]